MNERIAVIVFKHKKHACWPLATVCLTTSTSLTKGTTFWCDLILEIVVEWTIAVVFLFTTRIAEALVVNTASLKARKPGSRTRCQTNWSVRVLGRALWKQIRADMDVRHPWKPCLSFVKKYISLYTLFSCFGFVKSKTTRCIPTLIIEKARDQNGRTRMGHKELQIIKTINMMHSVGKNAHTFCTLFHSSLFLLSNRLLEMSTNI